MDDIKQKADEINARIFYEGTRRQLDEALWHAAEVYIERDGRAAEIALASSVQLTALLWLALYQSVNHSAPGITDRVAKLRATILRQMDMARQIVASASPEVTAEMYGLIPPKEPKEGGPTV